MNNKLTAETDPCWETNGKWTPRLVQRHPKPLLMHILGGSHEDFRTDSAPIYDRFRVVLPKPANVPAYVYDRINIDPFDWWWTELDDDMVAINFRLSALHRWIIKPEWRTLNATATTASRRSKAEHIARQAHQGQRDRGGNPYIAHVERVVANLIQHFADASEDEIAAAWLHDVIEDTDWTVDALRSAGITPKAVAIVEEVTRPDQMTYLDWIHQLAATGSLSAVKVKLADNIDNSSPDRVAAIPQGRNLLEKRYRPARQLLDARLHAESSQQDS